MTEPLWQPSQPAIGATAMTAFRRLAHERYGVEPTAEAVDRWSVDRSDQFWPLVWEFTDVRGENRADVAVSGADRMPGAVWFPMASLNFAENLLRRDDDGVAIIARNEAGERRTSTWRECRQEAAAWAAAFRDLGVEPGDRIAAYMPNIPETIFAMLGAAAVGAVFSSCSPDFGSRGVLDRFGQIEPMVFVTVASYRYNDRDYSNLDRVKRITEALPTIKRVVVVPRVSDDVPAPWLTVDDFLAPHREAPWEPLALPFNHALYVLFSSGTTGAPKCIAHSAGGTLIQHLKEHRLHCDVRRDDRVFYYTTCGWMMWNWLVTALASEATIVLYDGSPMAPKSETLFDLVDEEEITLFGTSAKYVDAIRKAGLEPARTHSLASMRTLTSTGSPLVPESFDWIYEHLKRDLHVASISGGTDIVSCFVLGDPTRPVYRGEIQSRGLGMSVEVVDDERNPVQGEKGELVCTKPFPSMPLGFWNDPGTKRYRAAYFGRFPGIWTHGDFAERTENGGFIIHGRSDTVLNPGGVRIGTAEIYRQVEQLDEIEESIAIGQDWDDDVRIVLFCKMRDGKELTDDIVDRIRKQIRIGASPRHVPAVTLSVRDIPRTKSGKISEIAVRDVVHGRDVKNKEALANPEALKEFRDRSELRA